MAGRRQTGRQAGRRVILQEGRRQADGPDLSRAGEVDRREEGTTGQGRLKGRGEQGMAAGRRQINMSGQ